MRRTRLRGASAAVWLALAPSAIAACAPGAAGARPNVLLVTLDTTRADHLGCYGYERDTSPHLDRLAAAGLVFERAHSTSSWTLPAHASLFTGKFTRSHGARYDPEGPLELTSGIAGPKEWEHYRARGLAPGETTLAGILTAAGYATGAVVAGPWMKRVFGLDLGFEHYDDEQVLTFAGRLAGDVTAAALRWLDGLDPGRPFFLFLNYYDPHPPLQAPEPYTFHFLPAERRGGRPFDDPQNWVDLYDAEIRYADACLGALIEGLVQRGLFDSTLAIVTADHGELFGEHGRWGHGESLSQAELHVPLIVRYPGPGAPAGRRSDPIQLVDVPALVLEALDLPSPASMQAGRGHPVVAELDPLEVFEPTGQWRALIDWPYKFVWNSQGQGGLYDLERDPLEERDLGGARAERMHRELEAFLEALPPPRPSGGERGIDPDLARGLRDLGYLGERE
jgi:arylsulfatase A-like enzyme